jgi:hypothetical protein
LCDVTKGDGAQVGQAEQAHLGIEGIAKLVKGLFPALGTAQFLSVLPRL